MLRSDARSAIAVVTCPPRAEQLTMPHGKLRRMSPRGRFRANEQDGPKKRNQLAASVLQPVNLAAPPPATSAGPDDKRVISAPQACRKVVRPALQPACLRRGFAANLEPARSVVSAYLAAGPSHHPISQPHRDSRKEIATDERVAPGAHGFSRRRDRYRARDSFAPCQRPVRCNQRTRFEPGHSWGPKSEGLFTSG